MSKLSNLETHLENYVYQKGNQENTTEDTEHTNTFIKRSNYLTGDFKQKIKVTSNEKAHDQSERENSNGHQNQNFMIHKLS